MRGLHTVEADPLPAEDVALLDCVEPVDDAHVLVIGDATLGMLCGLIRRGCAAAAEAQLHDRPVAEPAEIVVVPHLRGADCASRAVELARRVLPPGGRIVLRAPTGALARQVGALLRLAGFSAVTARPWGAGVLIRAERPSFGPLLRC